jgi:hypothetical protein
MRIFTLIIALFFIVQAQKRFTSDYFVSKYNLSLPEVSQEMLDISALTHTSDLWEYYYHENTDKLDSIVRMLTIEGAPRNLQKDEYRYYGDTVYVNSVSIFIDRKGDTSSVTNFKYTDEFRTQLAYKPKYNCIWKSSFDERGIKLLDVCKCPGDTGFRGQVFNKTKYNEYIESIETYRGEIDSNTIRRYYLTPFDSIVADFMVTKRKEPFIVRLNVYNNNKKKKYSFGFGIFSNINEVISFNYYTYTDKNQLHRSYYFDVINRKAKEKSYELVNYTEYEYDSLGRKIRVTTRVKPDPKEPNTEEAKK